MKRLKPMQAAFWSRDWAMIALPVEWSFRWIQERVDAPDRWEQELGMAGALSAFSLTVDDGHQFLRPGPAGLITEMM